MSASLRGCRAASRVSRRARRAAAGSPPPLDPPPRGGAQLLGDALVARLHLRLLRLRLEGAEPPGVLAASPPLFGRMLVRLGQPCAQLCRRLRPHNLVVLLRDDGSVDGELTRRRASNLCLRVEFEEVREVDGALAAVVVDLDANLELAPPLLRHLKRRRLDCSRGGRDRGVELENHPLDEEPWILVW
eukprot:CAMPEP_0196676698 /NCGR_PEP_ID=MMETSP1090-20130531/5109_1 /TAXON_ID=37098 /ORGANISM="Isochrysis sp, Strain CCMP1244" /LENGTH=187 /DNA_ID=CAMNT_0042014721 /DNA_START=196 /DNA_END=760 /DNA_ORIENTATION=-